MRTSVRMQITMQSVIKNRDCTVNYLHLSERKKLIFRKKTHKTDQNHGFIAEITSDATEANSGIIL